MRPTKKADRAMAGLMALMAQQGIATKVIEEVRENVPSTREAHSRQGEAVLLFLESPAKFTAKLCKRCGEAFGTNYRSVAYCTDSCRSKQISAELGVKWDWLRASEQERWGGEPPLIIPPKIFQKLEQFFQFFADIPQPQTQNQTEIHPEILDSRGILLIPENEDDELFLKLEDMTHTNPQILPSQLLNSHNLEETSPFDF